VGSPLLERCQSPSRRELADLRRRSWREVALEAVAVLVAVVAAVAIMMIALSL